MRRLRKVPLRLVLIVAALFIALTVLGGGTGLVLGKVASVGTEHRHHGPTLHEDDGDGASQFPRGATRQLIIRGETAAAYRHAEPVADVAHGSSVDAELVAQFVS